MALKDLVIPTVEVKVGQSGGFAVRGLSSTDIELLVRTHGNDLKGVWDEFLEKDIDLSKLQVGQIGPLIREVLQRIPAAMQDMIGLAADADDSDLAMLKKLPVGVQVSAIGSVLGLTLGTDGDWSKTMETVMQMIGGANGALGELIQQQVNKG